MPLTDARILLVEDNIHLAENVTEILEDHGGQVAVASTGNQARIAAKDGFDIALIDVRLPDSTGLDLLRELKSANDGMHEILLVTGNATIHDAVEAVKGGAYDYIIKPFRVNELIASVERAWRQVGSSRRAKALSQAIAERETSLRTLVDTVQALLLVLDQHGRVVQANPAVSNVTGLSPDEMVGMPWIETFVPDAERSSVSSVFARIATGERRVTLENRVMSADGKRVRMIRWQSSALEHADGTVLVYASGLDVTEVKELEDRTRLAERLAAVGTMAAGLAHEIRNPLNSALLQLQLLDRRLHKNHYDPKLLEPIALVRNEITRLSQLVREFLDFARPSVLDVEECDVVELVRNAVELQRPAASASGVHIELATPDRPVIVAVDRGKMQQVILNLLRNAIEALDATGRITVEVAADGTGALVRVRDNGPGIADDVLTRLFEPFFSTKEQGTGLGMAICHSLITQHGGDIRAYSDNGAVFEVTLPRYPPLDRRLPGDPAS
ncbi:MAG: ATP-binding protein [Proteobacteria bacterium]|nr:ATP-binding protein [Pseudomonadota bacterium]